MTDAAELSARLVKDLTNAGALTSDWRPAFEAVPRHRFLPDTVWIEDGDRLLPVRRTADHAAWLALCYANEAVITQVDDGVPAEPGEVGQEITSSSSRPDVVASMLAALEAEPGMNALEIGTGTGWNAALLAERLGPGRVTSVEVDPALAGRARRALQESGHEITVVTGDGASGHPEHAPFDRVIATVAADRVPPTWAAQTRPGGRVLVPWTTDFHNGALVAFTVNRDATMRGRIVGNVAFMRLRDQRGKRARLPRDVTGARRSSTELHPYDVVGEYDVSLAVGLKVPRCKLVVRHRSNGAYTLWLVDPWSGSWANVKVEPGTEKHPVHQSGDRNLWQEVEDAYHWWDALDRPTATRWGLTVTPDAQHTWLDTDDNRTDG
ncbi:methyltransferase domain-containing protein [Actinomadura harenae]|uniref:Protein-L-isoaspartate O-methyltransferase n=1 Tax=Actinomadura harenae TaxID=2483351 RepID=A0A3M2LFJ8_9ACTN|nr:methyltransferase domain-containing protein [Actinomadura harenae]RMI36291.1 methyltransferase domain-containing protein [Actinomadura harenae]